MTESNASRLVLTRREGEAIHIGSDITVDVVRVGQAVKLAIQAPREVSIIRDELIDAPEDIATDSSLPA